MNMSLVMCYVYFKIRPALAMQRDALVTNMYALLYSVAYCIKFAEYLSDTNLLFVTTVVECEELNFRY